MDIQKKVAVVYATDFQAISPGGIRNYILNAQIGSPSNYETTFFGVGDISSDLSDFNNCISLGKPPKNMPINVFFTISLRKIDFSSFDFLVFHRVENGLFIKRKEGQKRIQFSHGGTANLLRSGRFLFGLFYPLLEIVAFLKSDLFASISPKSTFVRFFSKIKFSRAPILIDTQLFNLNGLAKKRLGIALIGRLEPEKRFDLALELIKEAFNIAGQTRPIYIIGNGSEKNRLFKLAYSLKLNPIFAGYLDSNNLSKLLKNQINVTLLTSKFEGFPLVAVESAACGVRVVSLSAPGIDENLITIGGEVFENREKFIKALVNQIRSVEKKYQTINLVDFLNSQNEKYWNFFL